jgi:hypothetical protein
MPKDSVSYCATVSFKTVVIKVSSKKGSKDARAKVIAKINKKPASKYIEAKQFYLDKR